MCGSVELWVGELGRERERCAQENWCRRSVEGLLDNGG